MSAMDFDAATADSKDSAERDVASHLSVSTLTLPLSHVLTELTRFTTFCLPRNQRL